MQGSKVMHQSGAETLVTEEPYALIAHVRVCGGPVEQPLALPGSRPPPLAACAPAGVSAWGRRLTAGVRASAGTSRHSDEGCKSLTVKDQPTTLAPSHAQASVTASAKR